MGNVADSTRRTDDAWWQALEGMGFHQRVRVMRLKGFKPPTTEAKFWPWYAATRSSYAKQRLTEEFGAQFGAQFVDSLWSTVNDAINDAFNEWARNQGRSSERASVQSPLAAAARRLGLQGTEFTPEQVHRAWRTAAAKHHPDRGGKEAEFIACTKARDALLRGAEVRAM